MFNSTLHPKLGCRVPIYLFTTMKRYQEPKLKQLNVKIEAGFATSVTFNTPGGEFDYNDYGTEL